eukprot:g6107.t1
MPILEAKRILQEQRSSIGAIGDRGDGSGADAATEASFYSSSFPAAVAAGNNAGAATGGRLAAGDRRRQPPPQPPPHRLQVARQQHPQDGLPPPSFPYPVNSFEESQILIDEENEVYRLILTSLRATYTQLYEESRLSSHAVAVLCNAVDTAKDFIKGGVDSLHHKTHRPFRVLWDEVYGVIQESERMLEWRDCSWSGLARRCCCCCRKWVDRLYLGHRYRHVFHKVELLHGLVRGMQIVTKQYFSDAEDHGADHVPMLTAHDMMLERHGSFVELEKEATGKQIEDEIERDIISRAKKHLILMAAEGDATMELNHTVLASQTVIQVMREKVHNFAVQGFVSPHLQECLEDVLDERLDAIMAYNGSIFDLGKTKTSRTLHASATRSSMASSAQGGGTFLRRKSSAMSAASAASAKGRSSSRSGGGGGGSARGSRMVVQ